MLSISIIKMIKKLENYFCLSQDVAHVAIIDKISKGNYVSIAYTSTVDVYWRSRGLIWNCSDLRGKRKLRKETSKKSHKKRLRFKTKNRCAG